MIKSFVHKGLYKFFATGSTAGIQVKHASRLRVILTYLNEAEEVSDMNLPGFKLHQLKGDKKDLWSVWVNGNWRITFRFEDGNVYIVNYVDYH
jgi:proteic killer suppression protein